MQREEAARRARREQLAAIAREIVTFGDKAEARDFDLDAWADHRNAESNPSFAEVADAGNAAWHDLKKGLTTTLAVLKDESEEPADDYGLPVRAPLHAVRTIHLTRAYERKRAADEAARLEALQRVERIVQASADILGDAECPWLDQPHSELGSLSPREATRQSADLLWRTLDLLNGHAVALREKEKWVAELKRETHVLLRRPDKVRLYMVSGDPGLPGRASPLHHTKDQATMKQCLDLLKRRIGRR